MTAALRSIADGLKRSIERLSPYQSLLLLAVPASLVEPLKLVAVAVAGEGHWITGTAMLVAAYAASLLLVERLFVLTKPKLLRLRWFARLWCRLIILRYRLAAPFRHAQHVRAAVAPRVRMRRIG
jgi:hypothetical protein